MRVILRQHCGLQAHAQSSSAAHPAQQQQQAAALAQGGLVLLRAS
jgi:hypothetical protein